MELSIDPEFKRWIAALTTEEYVGLRENIKQNGCTQPIDVWNGIIIDGHHRYKICKELNIPFQVHEMDFASRDDAKDYMISNQLSRRNLTNEQKMYLLGKLYNSRKNKHGTNQHTSKRDRTPQNEESTKSEQLGEQFNVGHATVERAEKYALAVDSIALRCGHDVRDKILAGTIGITKADVVVLATLPPNKQMEAVSKIKSGIS